MYEYACPCSHRVNHVLREHNVKPTLVSNLEQQTHGPIFNKKLITFRFSVFPVTLNVIYWLLLKIYFCMVFTGKIYNPEFYDVM